MRKEKIDMENALEQEQEMIVNRLQKKLQRLQQSKNLSQNFNYDSRCESSSDEISTISSTEALHKYEELKKQYENQQSLIVNLRTQIDELTQRIEKIRTNNLTLSNASTDLVGKRFYYSLMKFIRIVSHILTFFVSYYIS